MIQFSPPSPHSAWIITITVNDVLIPSKVSCTIAAPRTVRRRFRSAKIVYDRLHHEDKPIEEVNEWSKDQFKAWGIEVYNKVLEETKVLRQNQKAQNIINNG